MDHSQNQTLLDINIDQQIAVLTLNSPPANVISTPMLKDLEQACSDLAGQTSVLIITGAGNHSFSAGANIEEQARYSIQENKHYFLELYHMLEMIADFPCPVISAINGYALGAGFELALCTDIRVLDEQAVMGAVAVNLGLVFSTQRLPRLIGYGKAKELLFTGRRINAAEALALGLVDYVTPAGWALSKAQDLAKTMASKNTYNLQHIKQAVNQGMNMNLTQAMELESQHLFAMFDTENYRRRLKKFLHK